MRLLIIDKADGMLTMLSRQIKKKCFILYAQTKEEAIKHLNYYNNTSQLKIDFIFINIDIDLPFQEYSMCFYLHDKTKRPYIKRSKFLEMIEGALEESGDKYYTLELTNQ